ncbi:hypothetical protein J2S88_002093 [Agrobacterium tumefaciens]|uniref:Uncharacterized protein n=1 Tax=Agrobacterium tumefaciens str. Kerr 14 TaxID=1183424 RepID=A0A1S7PSU7_AGRTU|nr:hypothetical protein [Agrobacterium tumefaciens]MDP9853144.1 hypothetical protein [Agrobacterium tumefaciens]MDP9870798.1 hypothetical protein [Agrobacterium tumefaciens]MDP9977482.1 hypothetical protein [Agrobacterium tumefaciens]CUX25769.1 conserved hypothetical protein [Agrobacterium tumefaciens str. Kerr 14]
MTGLHCDPGRKPDGFPETAAHAISLDRVALSFCYGKTDARLGFRGFPVKHFQKKGASPPFFPRLNGKKLRPVFKPAGVFFSLAHVPTTFIGPQARQLSRQTCAAARTAGCENLATAGGSHAGTETMTTLANKLGRLVSTLRHLFNTAVCGPS